LPGQMGRKPITLMLVHKILASRKYQQQSKPNHTSKKKTTINNIKIKLMGSMYSIIALLNILFYIAIIAGVFYMIYTWVNKFIALKKEQNDLLREIIKKLGDK